MECPRCKEDIPLLSNICTVCGYVASEDSRDTSAQNTAIVLEQMLRDLKKIPTPSFSKSMEQYTIFMLPIFAIFLFIISIITEALLFWAMFAVALFFSAYYIIKKTKGKLGNDPFNKKFENIISEFDFTKSIALMKYGKNKEISKLVENIAENINQTKETRKKLTRKNLIVWISIFIVLLSFVVLLTDKTSDVVSENTMEKATFEEIIQTNDINEVEWEVIKTKFNELVEPNANSKTKFIEIAIRKGKAEYAINYFNNNALAEPGDYKLATAIIDLLRANSQENLVEPFKNKCNGKLRYNSDNDKLKKY